MYSRTSTARLLAAAAAIGVLAAPAAAQSGNPREARVHVSVTDRDHRTLPLGPADITITEDGRAREVLRVEKASGPLQVALLVDDSQAAQGAIHDIRSALTGAIAKILDANPASQIAVITFGERPTLLTDYTSNRQQLARGIGRIFSREGAGAYMLEAIMSAARGARKRDAERPHIIVIGTEGTEFSNDHYSRVLDALAGSGATLWAVTLTAGPRAGDTDEVRNRSVVLGRGTSETGGRQEQALANSAVPIVLNRILDLMLNQYAVTYGRPDTLVPPKTIEVKVRTPDARLLAPSNAPAVRRPANAPAVRRPSNAPAVRGK